MTTKEARPNFPTPLVNVIQKALGPINDRNSAITIGASLKIHRLASPDPNLGEGFKMLTHELEKTDIDNSASLDRGLKALLLANILSAAEPSQELSKNSQYVKLNDAVNNFRLRLTALSESEDEKPKDTERKISLLKSLRGTSSSLLFQNCGPLQSVRSTAWLFDSYRETERRILSSPHSPRLLLNGKLEELGPRIKGGVWSNAVNSFVPNSENADNMAELVDFFIKDKSLQDYLWKKLGNQFINIIFPKIFMLNPQKIEPILDTIPLNEVPAEEQTRIIRKILIVYLEAKAFPSLADSPNAILNYIQQQLKAHGLEEKFTDYFEIIADKKPGIIYVNANFEARTRSPNPNQTREEFLTQITKAGIRVIYESKAEWPTIQAVTLPKEPEKKLTISSTETRNSELWGEVLVPNASDVPIILSMLASKLEGSALTEEKTSDLFEQYQKVKQEHSLTIIPDILPSRHPLKLLAGIGVLAIEQKENQVSFLLQTPAGRIALRGQLDPKGYLTIPDSDGPFQLSTLHLLLNAACLFGKSPLLKPALTKDEISQLHSFIKTWNNIAKTQHLPLLEFGETENGQHQKAIFLMGKKGEKLILLTLIPPKL